MDKINCKKSKKYWNNVEKRYLNQYSLGYIIPEEKIARYRFKRELIFLNKKDVFGGNYLDIGCGTGNFLFEWKDKYENLIGIDFSKTMVEFAKKKCKGFSNIKIYKDNASNFEKYIKKINNFSFVFIGGCLSYLNDAEVASLLQKLLQKLKKGGVIVFREPIAKKKRILEDDKNYTCIRRTVEEYKKLITLKGDECKIDCDQNYSYNYAMIISFYWRIFPLLNNKIKIFENMIVEFFFLLIPLKMYTLLKGNMVLNYFFVIRKMK